MGGASVPECEVFRKAGERFEQEVLHSMHLHCFQWRKIGNGNQLLQDKKTDQNEC